MKAAYVLAGALALLGGSVAGWDGVLSPRVRTADEAARQLLGAALQWSATARDLVAELEGSDLIVLISVAPQPANRQPLSYHAGVRLLSAAGGQRYVAVWIDSKWPPGGSKARQIALLAHELQHAVELARHPGVSDQAGMATLFGRLGREMGRNLFETEAALQVESRVMQELSAAGSSMAAAPHAR